LTNHLHGIPEAVNTEALDNWDIMRINGLDNIIKMKVEYSQIVWTLTYILLDPWYAILVGLILA
jgi:hypothetical protein